MGSSPAHRALSPRIPIPIANAIRWEPIASAPAPASERYPLFVVRSTLSTMHEHVGTTPGAGALGFLIGNILECPETTVRYVVLHTSVAVAERLKNDDSLALMSRLWPAVQQEARVGGGEVLGWYHAHAGQRVALTPRDVATHLTYFPDPWQSALVIAADGDRLEGGVFRVAENDIWPEVALPMYELFGPARPGEPGAEEGEREGEGGGRLEWTNYRIGDRALGASPTASAAPAALPPGKATPHILPSVEPYGTAVRVRREEPKAVREPRRQDGTGRQAAAPIRTADASMARHALPVPREPGVRETPAKPLQTSVRAAEGVPVRAASLPALAPDHGPFIPPQAFDVDTLSAPWRERVGPLVRRGASGLGILVLVAALWLWLRPSPAPDEPAPPPLPSAGAVIPHIRLADSLEQALRGFGARQQLFGNQQMTCDDLASGLVAVDEQWVRYSIARRAGSELADSGRDNAFAARVGSVERAFDASGCPRP